MPGGKLDPGEGALEAAIREFEEETGFPVPGRLVGDWVSPDGVYHGFVYVVDTEAEVPINLPGDDRTTVNPDDPDGDLTEVLAWWHIDDADGNPAMRDEVRSNTPWDLFRQPHAVAAALAQVAAISDPLPIIGRDEKSLRSTSKRLAKVDDDLRRKLRAGAEVALADGLRRAGVKVTQRAVKRSKALQASVASCSGVYPPSILAAAGITEQEAMAHAFDAFAERADRWLADAHRRKLAILEREFGEDAARAEKAKRRWQLAREAAVAFLVGSLTRMAFRRLTGTHPFDSEGEDVGVDVLVPEGLIGDALAVADGKPYSGDPLAGDAVVERWGPGVTFDVIDDAGRRSGIILDGGRLVEWIEWVHGDPEFPFQPHVDLHGQKVMASQVQEAWSKSPEVWPYNTTYWFPGDHHSDSCRWVPSWEPAAPAAPSGDATAQVAAAAD